MKPNTLCLALFLCGFVECRTCTAEAQPARVEAAQVCAVHRAVSHERAWSPARCAAVATILDEFTGAPLRMLAMAVNESNMRADVVRVTVRSDGLVAYDVGLLQVRCLVDPKRKDAVCLNGPAKGLRAKDLKDPTVNVRTAWEVYDMHGRDPGRYNGATGKRAKRYRQRVSAIEAALIGMPFVAPDKRTRGLCKRIVEAMGKEPRS